RLPKNKFVELLRKIRTESMKPKNIINGFKFTGVFPVDRKQFPESDFNRIALRKYKKKIEEAKQASENLIADEENHLVLQQSSTYHINDHGHSPGVVSNVSQLVRSKKGHTSHNTELITTIYVNTNYYANKKANDSYIPTF
ncbi:hypothetical protein ILUMI_15948, partial [Ignelater luminosus]